MSNQAADHDALMDLAHQAGLSYIPGEHHASSPKSWNGLGPSKRQPKVEGEFRGRHVIVQPIVNFVQDAVSASVLHDYAGTISQSFTHITLQVQNRAGLFLKIRPEAPPGKQVIFQGGVAPGVREDRFPRDTFAQRAVGLVASRYPPAPDLGGVPYIRLEGSELVCIQDGYPNDLPAVLALLSMLCDLAELAEDTGKDVQ